MHNAHVSHYRLHKLAWSLKRLSIFHVVTPTGELRKPINYYSLGM